MHEPVTSFYFFSGKGGVGKTTMACATAVYLAGTGRKTLIVTTDPASNLADVFEQTIGSRVTNIDAVPNLFAVELDPDKATEEYKERTLAPLRSFMPEESLKVIEEQLSSPCTAEVAAFERFTEFLGNKEYDVVIFDTAPTGHTLRLIQLPVEWSGVIENSARDGSAGQTCVGPAAALAESKIKFDQAISAMRNPEESTFIFVLRPEATPIYETRRSVAELQKLGIDSQQLIVNGIYPESACDNPFMKHRFARQQEFIRIIKDSFSLPARLVELRSNDIKGPASLAEIGKLLLETPVLLSGYEPKVDSAFDYDQPQENNEPDSRIRNLLVPQNGFRRRVFFAGKGGVGKTSVASATAIWVARRGYKTLLVTTDPASHLVQVFDQQIENVATRIDGENNLWVTFIDPPAAARQYKERVLAEVSQKYDQERVMAISEELDSPCTEEMATFEKFIEYATLTEYEVIIFDTAPTGHTLRLLKLPVDWNKQLEIKIFTSTESEADKLTKSRFTEVISTMQDKNKTTFAFVMYPESTPIEEASRAMADLGGIGIETSLVVANLVLPDSILTNEYLSQRKAMQVKYLEEMGRRFSSPIVTLNLMADDLIGRDKLAAAGMALYGT